jgi:hypothetical protein
MIINYAKNSSLGSPFKLCKARIEKRARYCLVFRCFGHFILFETIADGFWQNKTLVSESKSTPFFRTPDKNESSKEIPPSLLIFKNVGVKMHSLN